MQFRSFVKKIVRSQLDFSKLEKNYRIDSLALHKLSISKILDFYRQIDVKYSFQSKKGKTWFQNQLRIFIWVIFNYSNYLNKKPHQMNSQEWMEVSQYFHKDYLTCKYFFLCIQKIRKSQWTKEEDAIVKQAINKATFTNQWTQIGKELFIRSQGTKFKKPKQIRERWNNYLNPNVLKDKWSIDEDLVLFRIVAKEGRKWALISKVLKTRSEHSVKNRYTNLLKKFKSNQSNSIKFRRSQLQYQFIRYTLKRLQQDKSNPNRQDQGDQGNQINGSLQIEGQKPHNDKNTPTYQDSHSLVKESCFESVREMSPQLQFIKSPIRFEDKQDDFMSTENLMRSFQPSYHNYLF